MAAGMTRSDSHQDPNHRNERRASARLVGSVKLSISSNKNISEVDVINVSMSGLLCRLQTNIALMTKIELTLFLPNQHATEKPMPILIQGVVVRSEKREPYHLLAIYFASLSPLAKTQLTTYLNDNAKPDIDQLR